MKKATYSSLPILFLMLFGMFISDLPAKGQELAKESAALPEEISKIVTASCMPCHTSTGGLFSAPKICQRNQP